MPELLGRLAITNHDDEIGLFVFFDLNLTDVTQRRRTVVPSVFNYLALGFNHSTKRPTVENAHGLIRLVEVVGRRVTQQPTRKAALNGD